MSKKTITTRVAPSPTGFLHLGTARTALFNFLFAKGQDGNFIVRVEDTDKERSKKEFENDILEQLEWLALVPDAIFHQSSRTDIYKDYLQSLLEKDLAYISPEPKKDDPTKTVELIRLRNPGSTITFNDIIRGEITFDTAELGDMIIARSIDEPLYHFAVVVDDHEMDISHVIRGEDHISNTPRQMLIQQALGLETPQYAHIPLILAPDRSKMSKRAGATAINNFREKGYLPEALINYLALLGWNPGTDQELLVFDELIAQFNLKKVQKGGAVFNQERLDWFNEQYIARLSEEEFKTLTLNRLTETTKELPQYSEERLEHVLPIIREHITVLSDINKMEEEGELAYFFQAPSYQKEQLVWKETSPEKTATHINHAITTLTSLEDTDFTPEKIKDALWDYADKEGRGEVLWPIRYALSGKEKSPDPFTLAAIVGKAETLSRLNYAYEILNT